MTTTAVRNFLPKEIIGPLNALGQFEWLAWRPGRDDPPTTKFWLQIPADPRLHEHQWFVEVLRRRALTDPASLLSTYAYSKLLAGGPNVLRPTAEQCVALEQVHVNVAFADYEQPFPAFLVELPDQYRRSFAERFNYPAPRFVVVFHDRRTGYLVCTSEYGADTAGTFNILAPRPTWVTIEDAIGFCAEDDGPDLRVGELMCRVGLNLGRLLSRAGSND